MSPSDHVNTEVRPSLRLGVADRPIAYMKLTFISACEKTSAPQWWTSSMMTMPNDEKTSSG